MGKTSSATNHGLVMTHDEAFLQAILESPDDDAPRLVYADWLDEHGDPARAEFIRLQCRLENMSLDDPSLPDLLGRACLLHVERANEWLGDLRRWLVRWTFHRGFLDEIVLSSTAYLAGRPHTRPATVRRVAVDLTTESDGRRYPLYRVGKVWALRTVTRVAPVHGPRVRFYPETDPSVICRINCGILFLTSFGGPWLSAFHDLGEILETVDPKARLELVVVDIDGCSNWHQIPEFRNISGWGIAWVMDGQIVRAVLERPQEGFESLTWMLLQQCSE
jgi:uncharacterized protein (TIGR02996 family)